MAESGIAPFSIPRAEKHSILGASTPVLNLKGKGSHSSICCVKSLNWLVDVRLFLRHLRYLQTPHEATLSSAFQMFRDDDGRSFLMIIDSYKHPLCKCITSICIIWHNIAIVRFFHWLSSSCSQWLVSNLITYFSAIMKQSKIILKRQKYRNEILHS